MSLTRIVLFFWGGLYCILGSLRVPGDGDLYWQRWLGEIVLRTHRVPNALGSETFTASGAAWVPQEWLFSVLTAIARDHNAFPLFAAMVGLLPLGILVAIVLRARNAGTPQAIGIALIFAGLALTESFGVRAQVVGWFCLAWFLLCVERRDPWRYAAIPITVVWANFHASVMLAPVLVAGRIGGMAFDRQWREIGRELWLCSGVALAICCTPLGLRLPLYALTLAHSPIRHFITEWQPGNLSDPALVCGALPLAIAIAAGFPRTARQRKPEFVVAAMLFCSIFFAARNIAIFAIAAAPLAAAGIAARFPRAASLLGERRDLEYAAFPSIAVALFLCAVSVLRHQALAPPVSPIADIAALARDGSSHRVFCEDFTWCSAALQYPDLRVFIDGRCDPYPLPVWRQYIDVVRAKPKTRTILAAYDVDAVVARSDSALARGLNAPPWHVAARDRAYVLIRRD